VKLALVCVLACVSCSTFHETHYFRSQVSKPDGIPNYYKLTVEGNTRLSSSRYLSGYFDEDTLNRYFNEFTQPSGGGVLPVTPLSNTSTKLASTPGAAQGNPGGASTPAGAPGAVSLATGEQTGSPSGPARPQLIMILSSNSDEIASQIGALASSKDFTGSLARILGDKTFRDADEADLHLKLAAGAAKNAGLLTDALLSQLTTGATQDDTEMRLLTIVNTLAANLGHQGAFESLREAQQWVDANRNAIVRVTQ
jgi:hypothetical protein